MNMRRATKRENGARTINGERYILRDRRQGYHDEIAIAQTLATELRKSGVRTRVVKIDGLPFSDVGVYVHELDWYASPTPRR